MGPPSGPPSRGDGRQRRIWLQAPGSRLRLGFGLASASALGWLLLGFRLDFGLDFGWILGLNGLDLASGFHLLGF